LPSTWRRTTRRSKPTENIGNSSVGNNKENLDTELKKTGNNFQTDRKYLTLRIPNQDGFFSGGKFLGFSHVKDAQAEFRHVVHFHFFHLCSETKRHSYSNRPAVIESGMMMHP
jgi:hypothetical protein